MGNSLLVDDSGIYWAKDLGVRQRRDWDLRRRGSSSDCFNWKIGKECVREGRKEHRENKLGEVGTKNWELPQVYCLEEIEEESSGQEVEEDGEQG